MAIENGEWVDKRGGRQEMTDYLKERRDDTWRLMLIEGHSPKTTARKIAEQYDEKVNTIEKDISKMDEWLPRLGDKSGMVAASILREIRHNRQRRHEMAEEARMNGDIETERRLRNDIDNAAQADIEIAQSIGEINKEPARVENVSVSKQYGEGEAPGRELSDTQESVFDSLREKARDASSTRIDPGAGENTHEEPIDVEATEIDAADDAGEEASDADE